MAQCIPPFVSSLRVATGCAPRGHRTKFPSWTELSHPSCPPCTCGWDGSHMEGCGHPVGLRLAPAPPPHPCQALCHLPCAHTGAGRGIQSPGLTLSTWFTISFMRFCTVRRSLCFLNCGEDTEGCPGELLTAGCGSKPPAPSSPLYLLVVCHQHQLHVPGTFLDRT